MEMMLEARGAFVAFFKFNNPKLTPLSRGQVQHLDNHICHMLWFDWSKVQRHEHGVQVKKKKTLFVVLFSHLSIKRMSFVIHKYAHTHTQKPLLTLWLVLITQF